MPAQLDMFALRDTGMSLAVEAQDRTEPGWSERAYAAIVQIARRQRTVHVDDVLREFPVAPHHPNAWGSVWMRARRAGVIEHSGQVRPCTTDPRKHGHQYPVYLSLLTAT